MPYQKPQNYVGEGVIGLDLNISNIAYVGDRKAGLLPFAQNVPTYLGKIKQLQRKMERSRRNNNPDNYHPDSRVQIGRKLVKKPGQKIKGKRQWNNSLAMVQREREQKYLD